jgi:hypothetical protein
MSRNELGVRSPAINRRPLQHSLISQCRQNSLPQLNTCEIRQPGIDTLAKFTKCNEFDGCELPMNPWCHFVDWSLIYDESAC